MPVVTVAAGDDDHISVRVDVEAAKLGFEAALWLTRKLGGIGHDPLRKDMSTFFEVHETTGLPPPRAVRVMPNGTRIQPDEGNGSAERASQ